VTEPNLGQSFCAVEGCNRANLYMRPCCPEHQRVLESRIKKIKEGTVVTLLPFEDQPEHLRHFQSGDHTRVKAHWRGDPRLGICPIPDYKVRP
jgi:hypothetical protein